MINTTLLTSLIDLVASHEAKEILKKNIECSAFVLYLSSIDMNDFIDENEKELLKRIITRAKEIAK